MTPSCPIAGPVRRPGRSGWLDDWWPDQRGTSESLADARLYLCTDSRRQQGDLVEFLDAVLAGGVDIVQLREKNLEAADELELLAVFADACRRHGALLAVNDRADLAVAAGADVLHVGQRDLSPALARRIVGPDVLIGLSSHSTEQAAAAAGRPGRRLLLCRSDLGHPDQAGPAAHRPGTGRPRWPPKAGPAVVRHRRHRRDQPGPGAGRRRPPGGGGAGADRAPTTRAPPPARIAGRLAAAATAAAEPAQQRWIPPPGTGSTPRPSAASSSTRPSLLAVKAAAGQRVSVVIPARNEAATVGRGGEPDRRVAAAARPGGRAGGDRLRLHRRHRRAGPGGRRRRCSPPARSRPAPSRCRARARRCGSRCSSPPATCWCSSTPT